MSHPVDLRHLHLFDLVHGVINFLLVGACYPLPCMHKRAHNFMHYVMLAILLPILSAFRFLRAAHFDQLKEELSPMGVGDI